MKMVGRVMHKRQLKDPWSKQKRQNDLRDCVQHQGRVEMKIDCFTIINGRTRARRRRRRCGVGYFEETTKVVRENKKWISRVGLVYHSAHNVNINYC